MTQLRIACLCIGDELLDGRLADTNSQRLAASLFEIGVQLQTTRVVSDEREAIACALLELAQDHQLIVTSGGLGPTSDDLTAEGVARANGDSIRLCANAWSHIQDRFSSKGMSLPENNRRQAEVPESSRTILNEAGVAPAFVTPVKDAQVWSFPGVPSEFSFFLKDHFVPHVRDAHPGAGFLEARTVRCLGITESRLAQKLEPFEEKHPEIRIQYRTHFPENHVRLVLAHGGETSASQQRERMDALVNEARALIGRAAYGEGDETLQELVVNCLRQRGETVALAESCTGGKVSSMLTDVPGVSSIYVGGAMTYSNGAKVKTLGVKEETLIEHGAVSEPVAAEMAEGACTHFSSDWAISVTGIAGPGGGTAEKPVGTVCFGLHGPQGTMTKGRVLPFSQRERIRTLSASVALRWLLEELEKNQVSEHRSEPAPETK